MPETFITATAVGHMYGDRQILDGIDLTIHAGDRVALVGRNGSGKSTLLRLLAGLEKPTAGRIDRLRGLRVAWLPQVTATDDDRTVHQELAARTGVAAAEARMNRETDLLSAGDTSRIEAQTEAVEAWSELGGPDLDARVGQALERTGIDPGWAERPLGSLSGGQLARINLATLHLARLDVALLDEPGNHLDAEGLEMLGGLAEDAAPAVVLASHDRRLLEGFADSVFEIDRGSSRLWRGGWQTYLREQEVAADRADAEWTEAAAEKKRLVAMERRISQQAKTGERKARRSGETDKHIRYAAIQSAQKNTAISGIAKRIEQMEMPEKPWREDLSRLLLDSAQEVHSPQVAMVRGAVASRGAWRSAPIDLNLGRGERLLLSGPNGSGKSSLIAMLTGRIEPVSGSVEIPASLRFVELAQQGSLFADGTGSLADRFERLSGLDRTASRTALATMRIGAEQAGRDPAELSPGELTRAELALLSRSEAACLLLDEPSNHLDIEALEVLEKALEGWPGALVLASHDQTFREAIKFDRTIQLGSIHPAPGGVN